MTLLPAATEIVAALGGAGHLVGISHECDYPPALMHLPRVTTTPVGTAAPSAAIDAEVRRLREAGRPVIAADAEQLRRLAPDLIITQGVCEVCAVADGEVRRLADALAPVPAVLSLRAASLAGIFDDIRAVARAIDLDPEADELVVGLESRLARLRSRRPDHRPRVVCIEWLDPLYLAGHWVPELVEAAGGEDLGAAPGSHSARREWSALPALRPDFVVTMLCGFGVARTQRELEAVTAPDARAALAARPVWIVDGNAYTSRPGPRVVDGAERLQAMLHGRDAPGLARWRAPWVAA
ncbi:MAG TPA: ABC transporter substrate-binding protein [Gemmatimonadales bacterium]|nr:ABC transporter substrate-binding protein [Gemmatimonadales bacterium]